MNKLRSWVDLYLGFGWYIVPLGMNRTPIVKWGRYSEDVKSYEGDFARWVSDGLWEEARGIGVLVEPRRVYIVRCKRPWLI